jgi:hypothetical protein
MSVAFRREFLGASAIVRVDAAFGADLTVNSASWSWTDITSDVLYAGYAGVTISPMGRSEGSSTAQPSGFAFAVKNDTGNYTVGNPSSAYYPNVTRNTPVRVVVNLGAGDTVRVQGYANGWTPSWDVSGDHSIVEVSCSGVLRRLQQGSPAVQSAIYRSTISAPGLVKYVPMEEDAGAVRMSALGYKPQNAIFGGTVQFAGDATLGGAKQAVVLNSASYLGIATNPRAYGGHWQVDWFMKFTGSDPAAETTIMRCWTNSGTVQVVDAVYGGGGWGVRVYAAHMAVAGSAIFTIPVGLSSGWWHWRLMAHDGGSGGTDLQVVVFPVAGTAGSSGPVTIASSTPGNLTSANVIPNANLNGVAMCHWAIYDQWNFSAVDNSADGYAGEDPVTRIERLAAEEGIEISTIGTSNVTMGAQKPSTVMALLREAETADGGVLFDGSNAGLSYIAESTRLNAGISLALDASLKNIIGPPAATHDDQRDLNRATVSLPAGGSSVFEQVSGALGSDEIGVYETSLTANLETDSQALDLASWDVHLGQADGLRYPSLSLDLIGIAKQAGSSSIPSSWLGLTVGSRIEVSNLRSVAPTFPPGAVDVLLEGWSETITPKTWRATANCSPFGPWDVGTLDGYPPDCGASVLGTAMNSATTSMDVLVSDDCLWSHAGGDFSITVGGEEMTVTAASVTTTTTPALVAVGTADSSDGSTGPTVTPGLPGGLTAAGNLLLMFASCRDTNAVDTDMYVTGASGWKKIIDGVNFVFFSKVHSGSETTPTVHHSSAITGDTMIAQIASFSGKWGDPASQLVAAAQQLNAAAQNIAYPELPIDLGGVLIIWAGWKADDWTSVATLGGVTEISEATSVAGNDAGQVWDYNTSAGVPTVGGGSFVVTGGTSQISRGCVFALRSVYQTLTVTRHVNGISRAHSLGEAVHVTHPLVPTRQ